MIERDPNGKFLTTEAFEARERSETLARMAQGWQRSLERLKSDVEKLHGRYQKHGKRVED